MEVVEETAGAETRVEFLRDVTCCLHEADTW